MIFSIRASRLYLRSSVFALLFTFLAVLPALSSDSNTLSPSACEWAKLLRQAQHGNRRAQTLVGIAFDTGNGVKQDYSEAREWFLKAAKQADPIAEHNLGVMYYTGRG
jgi:TPR repeat protein